MYTVHNSRKKRQNEKSTACFDSFCLTCLEEFYDFAVIKEKNKVTQLKGLWANKIQDYCAMLG